MLLKAPIHQEPCFWGAFLSCMGEGGPVPGTAIAACTGDMERQREGQGDRGSRTAQELADCTPLPDRVAIRTVEGACEALSMTKSGGGECLRV